MPPKKAGTKRAAPDQEVSDAPVAKKRATGNDTKTKDPKNSHLYTDDNPETTLHGTGFKDRPTAEKTIKLVSQRSLTYQFQTINTMLYRARGHKSKTAGIEDAIKAFQAWVSTYKDERASRRAFNLLSKPKVQSYLQRLDAGEIKADTKDAEFKHAEEFARLYVELGARKRLANTLVDMKHPEGEDWEVRRWKHLCDIVPEDPKSKELQSENLWEDERERKPTMKHLTMILWGYSPSKKA